MIGQDVDGIVTVQAHTHRVFSLLTGMYLIVILERPLNNSSVYHFLICGACGRTRRGFTKMTITEK